MFVCLICKKKFSVDISKEVNDEIFQCKTCEKIFNDKEDLDVDINKKNKTRSSDHVCDVCNKKFGTKYRLKVHHTIHTNEKKYVCQICPDKRLFKTKGQLKSHMVLHYEPQFSCSRCGKKFHTLGNTKQHLNRNIC